MANEAAQATERRATNWPNVIIELNSTTANEVATSVVVVTAVASIKLGIVGLIKRTTVAAGTHKFELFATTKEPTK